MSEVLNTPMTVPLTWVLEAAAARLVRKWYTKHRPGWLQELVTHDWKQGLEVLGVWVKQVGNRLRVVTPHRYRWVMQEQQVQRK